MPLGCSSNTKAMVVNSKPFWQHQVLVGNLCGSSVCIWNITKPQVDKSRPQFDRTA